VIAGFFALFQERLGVIRVFHIVEPLIPSGMAGKELVAQIDAQAGSVLKVEMAILDTQSKGVSIDE